jgi:hypothetical protein
MFHQVLSNLYMRMELNQQEGEGLVNNWRELVPVYTEMLKKSKHQLKRDSP